MTNSNSASMGTLRSFSAFAFDLDDSGSVVGGADVADVGLAELICTEAGKQRSED
jgi:hypothetical protein